MSAVPGAGDLSVSWETAGLRRHMAMEVLAKLVEEREGSLDITADSDEGGNRLWAVSVSWTEGGKHHYEETVVLADLAEAMAKVWQKASRMSVLEEPEEVRCTAGRLKRLLADVPDDMAVLLSRDPEGNGFETFEDMSDGYFDGESDGDNGYIERTWPRYAPDDDTSDVDPEDFAPDGATPCVILWP